MRFALTEDQTLLRETARRILQRECAAGDVRAAWESDSGRDMARWARLGDAGLLGILAPESLGGLGLDEVSAALVMEEAGRCALPEPFLETAVVAIPLLLEVERAEPCEHWVRRACAGQAVIAVGMNGQALVADAHVADLILVQSGDALFAVTPEQVEIEAQKSVDGARRLFRLAWRADRAARLAHGPAAARALRDARQRGALGTAAQLLGIAEHLLDVTVAYVKVRSQFDRPIGSFQAVKHKLADAYLQLVFARPLVLRAAFSVAQRVEERSTHVSMAKAAASETALLASRTALQLHGAIGYSFEYDLQLWMKRAWALCRAWGDARWHRAQVAANLLGSESDWSL